MLAMFPLAFVETRSRVERCSHLVHRNSAAPWPVSDGRSDWPSLLSVLASDKLHVYPSSTGRSNASTGPRIHAHAMPAHGFVQCLPFRDDMHP